AAQDVALDDIVFVSETWTAAGLPGLPSPEALAEQLPTTRGPAARLFAFGHDAWLLSAHLQQLSADPEASVDGATGRLSLAPDGRVQRRPAWARFSRGVAVPVAADANP